MSVTFKFTPTSKQHPFRRKRFHRRLFVARLLTVIKPLISLTQRCGCSGWCPNHPPERTPSARSATSTACCSDNLSARTAEDNREDGGDPSWQNQSSSQAMWGSGRHAHITKVLLLFLNLLKLLQQRKYKSSELFMLCWSHFNMWAIMWVHSKIGYFNSLTEDHLQWQFSSLLDELWKLKLKLWPCFPRPYCLDLYPNKNRDFH